MIWKQFERERELLIATHLERFGELKRTLEHLRFVISLLCVVVSGEFREEGMCFSKNLDFSEGFGRILRQTATASSSISKTLLITKKPQS
jgi:hypothetical protein